MSAGTTGSPRRAVAACLAVIAGALLAAGCDVSPFAIGGGGSGGDAGRADARPGGGGDGDGGDGDGATCIASGVDETCNELDDDCNGKVDDLFDKTTDNDNCGACNHRCSEPGAVVRCVSSACAFVECLPGFKDLDPTRPGCEYQCPVFPPAAEDCNGVDEDCDGMIDEAAGLPPPPAGLCRTTAGTPCAATVAVCATRGTAPAVTRWYCDYPATVEYDPSVPNGIFAEEQRCDGQDGDCDGVVDDSFGDLDQTCDDGKLGICRDVGKRRCDPVDTSKTFCDLTAVVDNVGTPAAETCNNLDDDCNGVIDDATGAGHVVDAMTGIRGTNPTFFIDTFEASRPDASAVATGSASARACSNPSVLPWRGATFAAARTACTAAGKRLCTAAEWLAACEGAAGNDYPYGDTPADATCNAEPFDGVPATPADDDVLLATGAMNACVSADGVLDLSGNLKEWTNQITGKTSGNIDIAVLRGGAYDTPLLGATCGFTSSRAAVTTVLPTIGFRCCRDTAP